MHERPRENFIDLISDDRADLWRGFRQAQFPNHAWNIKGGELQTVLGAEQVDLITREKYGNFEFELEWRISSGGNSGVIYLVSEEEDATWKTGPEMQVLDDENHPDGKDPKRSAGALYALISPDDKMLKPVGEYNEARLIVLNSHVEHWLNGRKLLEYELGSDRLQELIKQSKFSSFPSFAQEREGHIALQHHGFDVWYRRIRVRPLP
jgi:hypothetical protein